MSQEARRGVNELPARQGDAMASPDDLPPMLAFTPLVELQHLLKVAGSVSQDANKAWAEVWAELKVCATGGGMVASEAGQGFVPQCGWPEFLEKFCVIKFYLDSMQRICTGQR
jgi:hypothetical protein